MNLIYRSINLETMHDYAQFWELCKQRSSDYSPCVLLTWERALGYQIAFDEEEEIAWIAGTYPEKHLLAPVGRWMLKGWDEILAARFGKSVEFRIVPEKLLEIWQKQMPEAVTVIDPEGDETRATWEYLYKLSDLTTLAGKKYMKKRNRINQFMSQNSFEYLPITPDLIPRIIEFQQAWCDSYRIFNGYETIAQESEGIIRNILSNWERLPEVSGGAIEVMGKIVAYTIAETAGDTLLIHVEKASLAYNAAYQVINNEFLKHCGGIFKFVNREEDMGDPGLRDAKLSYHPTGFVKKYRVRIDL